jgi:hypothetical protein
MEAKGKRDRLNLIWLHTGDIYNATCRTMRTTALQLIAGAFAFPFSEPNCAGISRILVRKCAAAPQENKSTFQKEPFGWNRSIFQLTFRDQSLH